MIGQPSRMFHQVMPVFLSNFRERQCSTMNFMPSACAHWLSSAKPSRSVSMSPKSMCIWSTMRWLRQATNLLRAR